MNTTIKHTLKMSENTLEICMTKTKETKGTYVYTDDDETSPVQTLYIKKWAAKKLGDEITVTIEQS
jgi:hypothetical protein